MIKMTLEKPFGPKGTLKLRFDTSPAVKISPDNDEQGFAIMQARYRKGQPIYYPASGELKAGESCLIPEAVAVHYFGDWTIQQGVEPVGDPRRTWGVEQKRVFKCWGDFRFDYGRNSSDHTPLGPPLMPHVLLQKVDDRGLVQEGFEFRPREYWEVPAEETQSRPAEVILAKDVDLDALAAKIRAQMAAEAQAAPKKRGRPRKVAAA